MEYASPPPSSQTPQCFYYNLLGLNHLQIFLLSSSPKEGQGFLPVRSGGHCAAQLPPLLFTAAQWGGQPGWSHYVTDIFLIRF